MGKKNYATILKQLIRESQYPVFFGGAGVSTASGIPDFRGPDGLYKISDGDFAPEDILSYWYFKKNPAKFYEFYRKHFDLLNYSPNIVHRKLAEYKIPVITQNIDDLHERAGSENVIHVHGSICSAFCEACLRKYSAKAIFDRELWDSDGVPRCQCSGAVIKPGILLYGERRIDKKPMERAKAEIEKADLLIVGGTSLSVYPACDLIKAFRGKRSVIINLTPTDYDNLIDIPMYEKLGKIFMEL